jgi:Protein of unknown function (DUF2905)
MPRRASAGRRQAEGGYEMSSTLIIFGLVLPVAGVAWPLIHGLGLGRLPATSQSSSRASPFAFR